MAMACDGFVDCRTPSPISSRRQGAGVAPLRHKEGMFRKLSRRADGYGKVGARFGAQQNFANFADSGMACV